MMFFKNLFKKKEVKEEIVIEIQENSIICEHCNLPIFQHEKRVTKAKNKFHIKCYRFLSKKAKHMMFYGQ